MFFTVVPLREAIRLRESPLRTVYDLADLFLLDFPLVAAGFLGRFDCSAM